MNKLRSNSGGGTRNTKNKIMSACQCLFHFSFRCIVITLFYYYAIFDYKFPKWELSKYGNTLSSMIIWMLVHKVALLQLQKKTYPKIQILPSVQFRKSSVSTKGELKWDFCLGLCNSFSATELKSYWSYSHRKL